MGKIILRVSIIVVLLVAITYIIVDVLFQSNASTNTQFSGFGKMVAPSTQTNSTSTDKTEVSLDKVLINMHSGQYKYMKADMSFKMKDVKNADQVKKNMPYIRETVLKFSSTQNSNNLATDKGKQQYKADLQKVLNDTYGIQIKDIYFRNFVLAP